MSPHPPPIAKTRAHLRTHHGDTVTDEYAWLADRDDPDTMAYLTAENAYTEAATGHLAGLRETVFTEIRTRTQETDLSVPVRMGDFWYYVRTVEGQQYPIHCRCPARPSDTDPPATEGPAAGDRGALPGEQVLLDGNALAEGHDFFSLGTFDVSPDGHWLAYSTDFSGDERFTLRVKDLRTGEVLADTVPDTYYGSAWSLDASDLFYVTVDSAWRPYRVWRHTVGSDPTTDTLVFEETDERFFVGVELTRSQRYLLIDTSSKLTSEVWFIPAGDPGAPPRVVAPRRQGVEYSVEHCDRLPGPVATAPRTGSAGADQDQGCFLILHNDGAPDFALGYARVDAPSVWTPLVEHTPGTRLSQVDALRGHLVLSLRRDGTTGLRVLPLDGDAPYDIAFPEPVRTVSADDNPEYHSSLFRLRYTSLVTPDSVYDCDLRTGALTLRRRKPVLGGFDPENYEQHRVWVDAGDGTRIPISLMCRRGTPRDGSAPCLLYGYGSYEISIDPWFSIPRLCLVDRGMVFAVAHVRGGGEMGRAWYDNGKLLAKKNTFTDFVDCARGLVKEGWTTPDRLVARGGSAGGLLMGAVANLAPDAFTGIVAQVPFVDALNSILDPSLPLTVTEWEEWGNPLADPRVYAYLKSYTPYENVAALDYPAILAVTSLNDTRVLFHEPAKWVARLRAVAPAAQVLLKTHLDAGHGGRSGRYDAWREEAFITAWILDQVGLAPRSA